MLFRTECIVVVSKRRLRDMSAEIIDLRRHLARRADEAATFKAEAEREAWVKVKADLEAVAKAKPAQEADQKTAYIMAAMQQYAAEAVRIADQEGFDAFRTFVERTAKEG